MREHSARIDYYVLVGALEGLSRAYIVLLYTGREVEANLVRSLIDQYILRLGIEADKIRLEECVKLELPGEPLTINDMVSFLKMVKEKTGSVYAESTICSNVRKDEDSR